MKRILSAMVLSAAACMTLGQPAHASDYPSQPIKVIVPMAAGGGTDAVARLIAQNMADQMKATVIVDNRPGAGGQLGTEVVAAAKPDGHTVLFASSSILTMPYLRQTRFELLKDFEPVGQVGVGGFVMVLRPDLKHATLQAFLDDAKQNPGKFTFGSPGVGSAGHLALNLLKAKTGIEMVHVPFKSSTEIVNALVGGQIDCAIDIVTIQKPFIESDRVRALATTRPERDQSLPELPTFNELKAAPGGFEITFWYGMFVPRDTPKAALDKLRETFNVAMKDPAVIDRLSNLSVVPSTFTADEFKQNIASEIAAWRKIIDDNNLYMGSGS